MLGIVACYWWRDIILKSNIIKEVFTIYSVMNSHANHWISTYSNCDSMEHLLHFIPSLHSHLLKFPGLISIADNALLLFFKLYCQLFVLWPYWWLLRNHQNLGKFNYLQSYGYGLVDLHCYFILQAASGVLFLAKLIPYQSPSDNAVSL
jgi:hypothetical protein